MVSMVANLIGRLQQNVRKILRRLIDFWLYGKHTVAEPLWLQLFPMASCGNFENVYFLMWLRFRLREGKLMRGWEHWEKVFKNSNYCTVHSILSYFSACIKIITVSMLKLILHMLTTWILTQQPQQQAQRASSNVEPWNMTNTFVRTVLKLTAF
jgi:hypothetical protein